VRIQNNSKIERVLIFDLARRENRTIVCWLILHGWKEIVPKEEGRLTLPPMDRDGEQLAELFKACEGRFDAVICPVAYLGAVNWLLQGRFPSVSVGLERLNVSRSRSVPRYLLMKSLNLLLRGVIMSPACRDQ
jgi:hypothetical protein